MKTNNFKTMPKETEWPPVYNPDENGIPICQDCGRPADGGPANCKNCIHSAYPENSRDPNSRPGCQPIKREIRPRNSENSEEK